MESHLMGDVWPGIRDVSAGLREDALMIVAVQERVLDFPTATARVRAGRLGRRDTIRLKARLLEDDIKPTWLADMRLLREHLRVAEK